MRRMQKNQVTILFVCLNEERDLADAIAVFKEAGFDNILVVDDHSSDQTGAVAKSAGAQVARNARRFGFNHSVLKGLYLVGTKSVLIVSSPWARFDARQIKEFVQFGVLGGYGILLPYGQPEGAIDFAKILKKRYHLLLNKPGLQCMYLGPAMLEVVRKYATGGAPYIFFELLKEAVEHKHKIGVFASGVDPGFIETNIVRFIQRFTWLRRQHTRQKDYIKYAFPGLFKMELGRKIAIPVVIAALTVVITKVVEWTLAWVTSQNH